MAIRHRLPLASVVSAGLVAAAAPAGAHVISAEDHHAFEHKYAAHCLERERAKAAPGSDEKALAALCDCIAQEESKRLTIEEVKKYLRENKMPISLIMKSTGAAYNCTKKFP